MKEVSVLLPTRNSMPGIRDHIERMRQWLDLVDEVIAVDSESSDGTAEFVKRELAGPKLRFFNHPPGLYESWNFGIAHVRTPYTYISTVGDTITRHGLEHIIEVIESFETDVVISPPHFVFAPHHARSKQQWPIYWLIESAAIKAPRLLSEYQVFLLTMAFAPQGLLGSSASNLYRTSLLQKHPFPADFGHCSDTAWTVRHALQAKWAITPTVISDFVVHTKYSPKDWDLKARFHQLATETWSAIEAEQLDSVGFANPQDLYRRLNDVMNKLVPLDCELSRIRAGSVPWILVPRTWHIRSRRSGLRQRFKEIAAEIFAMDPVGDCVKA